MHSGSRGGDADHLAGREFVQEVVKQGRDIQFSLAQRRQVQRAHVPAEVEVFAESAFFVCSFQNRGWSQFRVDKFA